MYGTMLRSGSGGAAWRRWVVAALAIALIAGGPTQAWSTQRVDLPTRSEYALDGDRLLRLTWSGDRDGLGRLVSNGGELVLELERALDFDDAPAAAPVPRARGERRLSFLGSTPPPGTDPEPPLGWEPQALLRLTSDIDEIRLSYEVGPDRITMAIPRSELAGRAGPVALPVRLTINNATAWLDAPALIERGEVDAFGDEPIDAELERVFDRLAEPEQFADTIDRLQHLAANSALAELSSATSSCMAECLACGAALVGVALGTAAIGFSCSGVVFSGGITVPICYMAIVGGLGTVVVAAVNCAGCDRCIHEDVEPEFPDGPGSDPGSPDCDPCDGPCPDLPDATCEDDPEPGP